MSDGLPGVRVLQAVSPQGRPGGFPGTRWAAPSVSPPRPLGEAVTLNQLTATLWGGCQSPGKPHLHRSAVCVIYGFILP